MSSKETMTQAKWGNGAVMKPGRNEWEDMGKLPMGSSTGAEQGLSGGWDSSTNVGLQYQDSGHRDPCTSCLSQSS